MLTIASNITTRDAEVVRLLGLKPSGSGKAGSKGYSSIEQIAGLCINAGADILEINLQQQFDKPEHMQFAVNAVQQVTGNRICLSSNKAETLEAGLSLCCRPPIVNYADIDTYRLEEILPLAAKYKAEIILLASDPASPGDARQMLEKAAILVGAANEGGISNDRIIIDPGIFHITKEQGQHHLAEVMDFLRALPATFDPQVRSTCWIANSSAGAPDHLRPVIETTLLAVLSGIGLSSVFLDILRPENKQVVRLLKIINNEKIYADSEL